MQRWGQITQQPALAAVSSGAELLALRAEVDRIHVSPVVQNYILSLVRATRDPGREPRRLGAPAQFRRLAARLARPLPGRPRPRLAARSWTTSRPALVQELAPDVLRHRIGLTYEAEAQEITPDTVVSQVVSDHAGPARLMATGDTARPATRWPSCGSWSGGCATRSRTS